MQWRYVNMKTQIPKGKIGLKPLLRVSRHGAGNYLYLPKKICETYDIDAGDCIEVELLEHYKEEFREEEA
jgi:hypothetical protein